MLVRAYIERSLKDLESLYDNAKSQRKAAYYSKLAMIELCGWIEESIDVISRRVAKKKLKRKSNYDELDSDIKKINGFVYNKHIKVILKSLIGIKGVELFEKEYNKDGNLDVLTGLLSTLKESRDTFAHTFVRGLTERFQAPSSIWRQYKRLRPLIEDIERVLVEVI